MWVSLSSIIYSQCSSVLWGMSTDASGFLTFLRRSVLSFFFFFLNFFFPVLFYFGILVLLMKVGGGRLEKPQCLFAETLCPSPPQGKEKMKEEKTGEGNLLGMGFCSVENCQLGFLLQEPSVSTEFS